ISGQAETSFRVVASAVRVSDLEFVVSVSKDPFVELNVALTYTGPGMGGALRAMLYPDRACAALPPQPTAPPAQRTLVKTGLSTATLSFINLLSKDYAVLGRAETEEGRLLAQGCVDVPAQIIPPGSKTT